MGIALGAQDITAKNYRDFIKGIEAIFDVMLSTRPTAVNIKWAVERIKRLLREKKVNR